MHTSVFKWHTGIHSSDEFRVQNTGSVDDWSLRFKTERKELPVILAI